MSSENTLQWKKYISASLRKQSLKFTSDFSSPNERGNDSSTANREQMKSYGGATTALLPARHERVR